MRTFTREELARCNGQSGTQILVAYRGKVYDVSDSFLWKGGKHQAMHIAGKDLTDDLAQAPHGEDLLDKFPVVGTLA